MEMFRAASNDTTVIIIHVFYFHVLSSLALSRPILRRRRSFGPFVYSTKRVLKVRLWCKYHRVCFGVGAYWRNQDEMRGVIQTRCSKDA